MERLKSGCILANMGHSNNEINIDSLKDLRREKIRKNVSHVVLPNGRRIILIAEVGVVVWGGRVRGEVPLHIDCIQVYSIY